MDKMDTLQGPPHASALKANGGKKTHTEKKRKCSFKELGPGWSARNSRTRIPGLVVESVSSCTWDSVAVTGDKVMSILTLSLSVTFCQAILGLVAFCLLEADRAIALSEKGFTYPFSRIEMTSPSARRAHLFSGPKKRLGCSLEQTSSREDQTENVCRKVWAATGAGQASHPSWVPILPQ